MVEELLSSSAGLSGVPFRSICFNLIILSVVLNSKVSP